MSTSHFMGEMNWLLFPNHTQELLILDTYGEIVNSYELFFLSLKCQLESVIKIRICFSREMFQCLTLLVIN